VQHGRPPAATTAHRTPATHLLTLLRARRRNTLTADCQPSTTDTADGSTGCDPLTQQPAPRTRVLLVCTTNPAMPRLAVMDLQHRHGMQYGRDCASDSPTSYTAYLLIPPAHQHLPSGETFQPFPTPAARLLRTAPLQPRRRALLGPQPILLLHNDSAATTPHHTMDQGHCL